MEMNEKQLYEVPSITVVEVKTDGIICQSATRNGYGNSEEI